MRKIMRGILKGIYFVVGDKTKDKILDYLFPEVRDWIGFMTAPNPRDGIISLHSFSSGGKNQK